MPIRRRLPNPSCRLLWSIALHGHANAGAGKRPKVTAQLDQRPGPGGTDVPRGPWTLEGLSRGSHHGHMTGIRVAVVSGAAGGMSTAARLRRLDEHAHITVLERSGHVSFANCGLPYFVGGLIEAEEDLTLQTPEQLFDRFRLDVRVNQEVVAIARTAGAGRARMGGGGGPGQAAVHCQGAGRGGGLRQAGPEHGSASGETARPWL